MVRSKDDGTVELVNSLPTALTQRQQVPVVYDVTTVCYVANPSFVMSHESIFEGRVRAVHVPIERAIDIDTLFDFQVAEALLLNRKGI